VDDPTDQARSPSLETGRRRLQQVIVLWVGMELVAITTYLASVGMANLPQQVVRFLITVLLCLALWRGHNGVRWVVFGLALLAAMFLAAIIVTALVEEQHLSVLLVVWMSGYLVVAGMLLRSKALRAFMVAQRARTSAINRAAV
jgi:hypothetical protein